MSENNETKILVWKKAKRKKNKIVTYTIIRKFNNKYTAEELIEQIIRAHY